MRSQFILLAFLATACTNGSSSEPEAQEPEATLRAMSADTRWVKAEAPTALALLEAPARVVATTPASAVVTVLHDARIERFLVAPGDAVTEGQPLVRVAIPAVADAAARVAGLKARMEAVEARLQVLKKLKAEGLARAEAVFELDNQLGALTVEVRTAQAVLRMYGISDGEAARLDRSGVVPLVSPAAGVVTEVNGRLGAVVAPGGPPLVLVEGPRSARIEASLFGPLPEEAEVDFVGQDGRVLALEPAPVSRWVDGHSGRVTVWLRPAQEILLPDGLAGRVRIAPPAGTIEVPSRAVLGAGEDAHVYVLREGAPVKIAVTRGLDSGTTTLVRGALKAGESVAADASALEAPR
ncbi:MAG: efflux RND transporter periplasmic adaptor subunit [Deltaproteobacteria bacterium]|nr:efflux RND transporter periplasmic adaptor subunit [Deltaproteobacteria bacterium]